MPRVNIWLPDELYRPAKELDLPVSELAQKAIAAELERRRKTAALDAYLAELDSELGPATAEEIDAADCWAERLTVPVQRRPRRRSA